MKDRLRSMGDVGNNLNGFDKDQEGQHKTPFEIFLEDVKTKVLGDSFTPGKEKLFKASLFGKGISMMELFIELDKLRQQRPNLRFAGSMRFGPQYENKVLILKVGREFQIKLSEDTRMIIESPDPNCRLMPDVEKITMEACGNRILTSPFLDTNSQLPRMRAIFDWALIHYKTIRGCVNLVDTTKELTGKDSTFIVDFPSKEIAALRQGSL